MKQVIFLRANSEEDIQETINNWIVRNHKTNEIVDIKFNLYQDKNYSTMRHFTAMIIYESKTSKGNLTEET